MQNLSDCSLFRIFSSLPRDPLTLDSFRSTCKRINNQASSMELDKIDDAIVSLSSAYTWWTTEEGKHMQTQYYSIQGTIGLETPCPSHCYCCRMRKNPPPPSMPIQYDFPRIPVVEPQEPRPFQEIPRPLEPVPIFRKDEDLLQDYEQMINQWRDRSGARGDCNKYGRIFQLLGIKKVIIAGVPSDEYFISRFDQLLSRVRSVGLIKLSGLLIGETIMHYLTNHPKLTNVRQIIFLNCIMVMKKEEFCTFIQSKPIMDIHLSCRFKQFSVDESCLMGADMIFLQGMNDNHVYSNITDNLLRKWMINPPTKVSLISVVSNITVKGLLEFIKGFLQRNSSADIRLGDIAATKEEFVTLIRSIAEIRGLLWDLYINGGWGAKIRIKNNTKFKLSFSIRTKIHDQPLKEGDISWKEPI